MSISWKMLLPVAILALAVTAFALFIQPDPVPSDDTLLLLCGAGLRPPIEDIVQAFQRRQAYRVEVVYGASNLLLGQLKVSGQGDVFLPGDEYYIRQAAEEELVHPATTIAYFVPVILTARDIPFPVDTLADLTQDGLKLGLADARAAAIGRASEALLEAHPVSLAAVQENQVYTSTTVHELGTAVELGHIHAAIVWDAVAQYYAARGRTRVVTIPAEENRISPIGAAVVQTSHHSEAAEQFVSFLASPTAAAIFSQHGYTIALEGAHYE